MKVEYFFYTNHNLDSKVKPIVGLENDMIRKTVKQITDRQDEWVGDGITLYLIKWSIQIGNHYEKIEGGRGVTCFNYYKKQGGIPCHALL